MKAAGRRQKGKRLEYKWAEMIRESGLDKSARRRPLSGAEKMVKGYGDIISTLPFAFECKNQEKVKIWEWWQQADSQSTINKPPVLVFSGNLRPVMVLLSGYTFLDILEELDDYKRLTQELQKQVPKGINTSSK